MTARERELLQNLKDYMILKTDVESLTEKLRSAEYKTTATYGNTGGSGGYGGSKVESFSIRVMESRRELIRKRNLIDSIDMAIENAELSKREKELIVLTMGGLSLSSYARQKNIYKSHVYKIRDRALKKMVDYIYRNTK